jgi:hypothetical protein
VLRSVVVVGGRGLICCVRVGRPGRRLAVDVSAGGDVTHSSCCKRQEVVVGNAKLCAGAALQGCSVRNVWGCSAVRLLFFASET